MTTSTFFNERNLSMIWRGVRPVQGNPCMVLIDEYDDHVERSLANPKDAELIRSELAGIYGKIKGKTHTIRFLMNTSVSKFTKMPVFSALSNLIDITISLRRRAVG